MKSLRFSKVSSLFLLAAGLLLQACAPSTYSVVAPQPSDNRYIPGPPISQNGLVIRDVRANPENPFSYGRLPAGLILDGTELDPMAFLKEHTERELKGRGLAINVAEAGDVQIDVKKLSMKNYRSNAYAPFYTFTMLKADMRSPTSSKPIAVYVIRGKVPVWSFEEVVQPALNEPLDLLVKEFAAKINAAQYGQRISDQSVDALVSGIRADLDGEQTYLDVYELGFGNNPRAIAPLIELTKDSREYIRLAAISALGILKADGQTAYLKSLYDQVELWQDRIMVLKSLGDIGNGEALAFLRKVRAELDDKEKREAEWSEDLLGLYLP